MFGALAQVEAPSLREQLNGGGLGRRSGIEVANPFPPSAHSGIRTLPLNGDESEPYRLPFDSHLLSELLTLDCFLSLPPVISLKNMKFNIAFDFNFSPQR